MDNIIDYIGYIAAFFTTISTLPQLISTMKTKNVNGVSINMFVTLGIGVSFWLSYGILKSDYPLIIANSLTLFSVFANIYYIVRYRKK